MPIDDNVSDTNVGEVTHDRPIFISIEDVATTAHGVRTLHAGDSWADSCGSEVVNHAGTITCSKRRVWPCEGVAQPERAPAANNSSKHRFATAGGFADTFSTVAGSGLEVPCAT
jgi:hypothetical protein